METTGRNGPEDSFQRLQGHARRPAAGPTHGGGREMRIRLLIRLPLTCLPWLEQGPAPPSEREGGSQAAKAFTSPGAGFPVGKWPLDL